MWSVPSESNPRRTSRRPTSRASVELTTCLSSAANLRYVLSLDRGRGSRSRRPNLRQLSTRRLPCRPSQYRPHRHRRHRRRLPHRASRSPNLHRPLPQLPHQTRPRRSSTTRDEGLRTIADKRLILAAETRTSISHPHLIPARVVRDDRGRVRILLQRQPVPTLSEVLASGPARCPDLPPASLWRRDRGGRPQQSRSRSPRPDSRTASLSVRAGEGSSPIRASPSSFCPATPARTIPIRRFARRRSRPACRSTGGATSTPWPRCSWPR